MIKINLQLYWIYLNQLSIVSEKTFIKNLKCHKNLFLKDYMMTEYVVKRNNYYLTNKKWKIMKKNVHFNLILINQKILRKREI